MSDNQENPKVETEAAAATVATAPAEEPAAATAPAEESVGEHEVTLKSIMEDIDLGLYYPVFEKEEIDLPKALKMSEATLAKHYLPKDASKKMAKELIAERKREQEAEKRNKKAEAEKRRQEENERKEAEKMAKKEKGEKKEAAEAKVTQKEEERQASAHPSVIDPERDIDLAWMEEMFEHKDTEKLDEWLGKLHDSEVSHVSDLINLADNDRAWDRIDLPVVVEAKIRAVLK